MSLDKAIIFKKEKRKPYRGSRRYFKSCRNHGGCPWCEGNRRFKFRDKHPVLIEDDDAELKDNSSTESLIEVLDE